MVQSVPRELNSDTSSVLLLAQVKKKKKKWRFNFYLLIYMKKNYIYYIFYDMCTYKDL